MAKEAQAIGIDGQGQIVLEKETAKMFEVIPRCIGGDKDSTQEFSGMIVDREQKGLLVRRRPPLVDGGIVLPEFAEAGTFPATASFRTPFREADEVGKMRTDKSGDGFAVAFEAEADFQFIGGQLKIGRFLQWHKILEKSTGCWRPIGTVVSTGESGTESRAAAQPPGSESIKVSAADLEVVGGVGPVNFAGNKLLENPVEKRSGEAFGQLFFSQS
jgi:hypothetical protein